MSCNDPTTDLCHSILLSGPWFSRTCVPSLRGDSANRTSLTPTALRLVTCIDAPISSDQRRQFKTNSGLRLFVTADSGSDRDALNSVCSVKKWISSLPCSNSLRDLCNTRLTPVGTRLVAGTPLTKLERLSNPLRGRWLAGRSLRKLGRKPLKLLSPGYMCDDGFLTRKFSFTICPSAAISVYECTAAQGHALE